MSLYNPGPGEILDRLTILALKIVYGTQADRDTTHWKAEHTALAATFREGGWKIPTDHAFELAAVNAAIWQAEDEMRRLRGRPEGARPQWTGSVGNTWVVDVANVALRIQSLNDRRAELVTLINTNAGLDRPADKL